jgi:hypothetical protein
MRRIGVLATIVLIACSSAACARGASTARPPSVAPSASKEMALPAARDIDGLGGVRLRAFPFPDWTIAAAGSVWIAGVEPGVRRYDAATGRDLGGLSISSTCQGMD